MRRLGVYGDNLPTRKEKSIAPADFAIAGLLGNFSRTYDEPFRFTDTNQAMEVLGGQLNPAWYGWDALNGFFANLKGQSGSIYVKTLIHEGASKAEFSYGDWIQISSAYRGKDQYGDFGNSIAFTVVRGAIMTATVDRVENETIYLDSVTGMKKGDMLDSESGADKWKIDSVDESELSIRLEADPGDISGQKVSLVGYKIKVYVKSPTGVVSEVNQTLGNQWVTLNQDDPDRFCVNAFNASSYIKISILQDIPNEGIVDMGGVLQYLSGGNDGRNGLALDDLKANMRALDNSPVRMLSYVESFNPAHQKAVEAYCRGRDDNPIALLVGQMGMEDKADIAAAGQAFQRGDEVDAVYVHNWLGVQDPFSTSASAQKRIVPATGHLMGSWIQSIGLNGIHCVPSRKDNPILGASEVVGYQALNDFDRTDLASAGVNVLQLLTGRGIVLRNFFTPSISPEFRFSNGVIQRNFIKVSIVDALQSSENTPNSIARVREDKMAVLQFMNRLWDKGSNGNTPVGEIFGQYELPSGDMSTIEDAFEVIADASNNSVETLQAGERNIDVFFMFPAPAGSIKIGVGIIYRTA